MIAHEYFMLGMMTFIFLFAFIPSSIGKLKSYGGKWVGSNRVPPKDKELLPWAGRVERAYTNLKDYFPAFVVAILLLGVQGKFDETTKIASTVYVIARVLHFVGYGIGNVRARFVFYVLAMLSNVILLYKAIC